MDTKKNASASFGMTALLLMASFIWGTTFVAQSAGMDYTGPYTFICVRSLIASAGLFICSHMLRKTGVTNLPQSNPKTLIKAGLFCGLALFFATVSQQIGLLTTSAGKAGFITSLYILFVPVLGLFLHRPVRPLLWACVLIAASGLFLISVREDFTVDRGDLFMLLCALCFSVHIYVVDRFSASVDALMLCGMQFLVCGVLAVFPMLYFEHPHAPAVCAAWFPILYAALLSGGVAYTIQIVCQRHVEPVKASLLMCMESLFALLAGMVVLHERMSARELIGCALLFIAIVLSVLPEPDWRLIWRQKKAGERLH